MLAGLSQARQNVNVMIENDLKTFMHNLLKIESMKMNGSISDELEIKEICKN